jgi:putative Ca2+/H+ antiporter (TMEM165/GDT1 family)
MMFWKTFTTVLTTVFLAEIGDKTQLATVVFSADAKTNKWAVFIGSATALTLAAALGVLVGAQMEKLISPRTLKIVAGIGFVAIGIWTIFSK